jgi:hypothetical protein
MGWSLDPELKSLLAEVAAATAIVDLEPVDRPVHEVDVIGLFDRCRGLFDATRLLLHNALVHEAVILGRPLFTGSLMLAEYASSDKRRRAELAVGWKMSSISDFEKVVREGGGEDTETLLAGIKEQRTSVEGYAHRQGVGTKYWRPDDHAKDLAAKHGRAGEYADMLMTHQFVHGSATAVAARYSKRAEDTVQIGGSAVDLETWGEGAARFAAVSLLNAARAAYQILGRPEPEHVTTLLERAHEM